VGKYREKHDIKVEVKVKVEGARKVEIAFS
jgi:hypothetical protein